MTVRELAAFALFALGCSAKGSGPVADGGASTTCASPAAAVTFDGGFGCSDLADGLVYVCASSDAIVLPDGGGEAVLLDGAVAVGIPCELTSACRAGDYALSCSGKSEAANAIPNPSLGCTPTGVVNPMSPDGLANEGEVFCCPCASP